MPRLNIYVPNDVYDLASRWRETANLSEICARAIRDELGAAESGRTPFAVNSLLDAPTPTEDSLNRRFGLIESVVVPIEDAAEMRDRLGRAAAKYLDRNLCDGAQIAVAGGRQIWSTVRQLSPRRINATITALGTQQADPQELHAHPNTLATLLWLLYSPRSTARVIGSHSEIADWTACPPLKGAPSYFVLGSCSPLSAGSAFAKLIGAEAVTRLHQKGVIGDFAYTFIDRQGTVTNTRLPDPQVTLSADIFQNLSGRPDARVILVAGGTEKFEMISATLSARLCNVLVTDLDTAQRLMAKSEDRR